MSSVKLADLLMAFEFVSSGDMFESSAFISRSTGEIHWVSDALDEEELPEDIEDGEAYVEIPPKNDFDLGQRLVLKFVGQELPDCYDEVERIFSRQGAYSQYKALLERHGKLALWYQFEEAATISALKQWLEVEGFDLIDEADG